MYRTHLRHQHVFYELIGAVKIYRRARRAHCVDATVFFTRGVRCGQSTLFGTGRFAEKSAKGFAQYPCMLAMFSKRRAKPDLAEWPPSP